jgi:hypothetical protein
MQLMKVADLGRGSESSHEKLHGLSSPYHTTSQTLDNRTKTPTNQSTTGLGLYSASGTPRVPVIGGGYGTASKSPNHL